MSLYYRWASLGSAVALFLAMLLFLELGWRIGVRAGATGKEGKGEGAGLMDNAVYGLLALLIGFTFAGAASRFDARRALVGKITNSIGTAWMRIDALPAENQGAVRAPFRGYVEALLASYSSSASTNFFIAPPAVEQAGLATWNAAVQACLAKGGEQARMLLLPSLNEMFDSVEEERFSRRIHPPFVIFAALVVASLATSILAGYSIAGDRGRDWLHRIGMTATIAFAIFVIVELEFPRLGLVRIDATDRAIAELLTTLK